MKSSRSESKRKLRTVMEAFLWSGIVATILSTMYAYAQQPAGRGAAWCAGPTNANSAAVDKSDTAATSPADVQFMQGMIMHHAQAVEMTALIESHTENKDLRLLGARISHSQSDEIKFMKRWLAARGEPDFAADA